MVPNRPMHYLVHRGRRFDTEISFLPEDCLSRFGEINLTIMQRRGRRYQAANQLELFVNERVECVPKL